MALLVLRSAPVATSVFRSLVGGWDNVSELPIWRSRLHIKTYGSIQTLVETCAILEAEILGRTERCKN